MAMFLKKKGLLCLNMALAVISTILYLIFGISSGTFTAPIFELLAAATVLEIISLVYNGFFADYLPLLSSGLMSAAIVQFGANSVDDVTAFVVGMGNYFGNADNVGFRVVVLAAMVLTVLCMIISAFVVKGEASES